MVVKHRRNRKRKQKQKRANPLRDAWLRINFDWLRQQWLRLVTLCTVGAISVSVYVATLWVMNRPIQSVVIEGAFERVSAIQVEDALQAYIQTGFLSADLHAMRDRLRQLDWIANAKVRRRWPGTIEVQIEEQRSAARWGQAGLLNVAGELFVDDVTHVPAELPQLAGPEGTERRVADMYFGIQQRLDQRGLSAVSLRLDERGAWHMQLSSGVRVRFGARMVDIRMDRFFDALDKVVAAQMDQVDYIDMRYTNGFAIGWKEQSPMNAKAGKGAKPSV